MSRMSRAAEYWWNLPLKGTERKPFINPPEAAYYERDDMERKWNIITWADVHKKRTEKIKEAIYSKRKHENIKPCLIWVFSNEGRFFFGGTYTIVKTINTEHYLNFRNEGLLYGFAEKLQLKVMQCFHLCLPMPELFSEWMELFCKRFHNATYYAPRNIQGTAKCWCKLDEHGSLIDIAPNFASLEEG